MKKNICLIFTVTYLSLFLISCGNPLDVLGPRDKPNLITSFDWDNMQVVYWVYTTNSSREIKRTFIITKSSDINKLKSIINEKEVSGLSTGTNNQLIFRNGKNDIWHGGFCFENTLYMSLSKDGWRSYKFVLSGLEFYNKLRRLCAQNEKQYHQDATYKHIKLRSNLVYDYPKLKTKKKSN